MNPYRLIASAALPFAIAAGLAFASPASAAPSYDACTHTVSSLPVVITAQGTWCLKGDVSTAITSGIAIDIQANNVTLDCNGFKVGGLGAGISTSAIGVSTTRLNTVIRGCNVRGFKTGIEASGEAGTVEDNRLESNTSIGIYGEGTIIRHNVVLDTGGSPLAVIYGILVLGNSEVTGNRVDGTTVGTGNNSGGNGIYGAFGEGIVIRDNVILDIHDDGSPGRPLVLQSGTRALVSGNFISRPGSAASSGIACVSGLAILRDNTVIGYTVEDGDCIDGGGNWFN